MCEAVLRGKCQHGVTGRKGSTCPHPHPKRCEKLLNWSSVGERGCDSSSFGKFHPEVCPSSLHLQCFDKNCKWKLHIRKCRRPGQPDTWQVQGSHGRQGGGQGRQQGGSQGRPQGGGPGRPQGGGQRSGNSRPQKGKGNQPSLFQQLTAWQSQPGAIEEQLQTLINLMQLIAPQNKGKQGGRRGNNHFY